MKGNRTGITLLLLAVFAVAMAHLEGVAVVYIQRILDYSSGGDFQGYLIDKGITTLQGFTEYLEGREILWRPESAVDSLRVGIRAAGGVTVKALRAKDVG